MKTGLTAYFYMRADTLEQVHSAAPRTSIFVSKNEQVFILSATAAATRYLKLQQ